MLLPWADLAVPFLSHQMKTIGKRVTLRRRQAVQGVGKSFTIHLEEGTRARLS
jgi:putative heme degradation protein